MYKFLNEECLISLYTEFTYLASKDTLSMDESRMLSHLVSVLSDCEYRDFSSNFYFYNSFIRNCDVADYQGAYISPDKPSSKLWLVRVYSLEEYKAIYDSLPFK